MTEPSDVDVVGPLPRAWWHRAGPSLTNVEQDYESREMPRSYYAKRAREAQEEGRGAVSAIVSGVRAMRYVQASSRYSVEGTAYQLLHSQLVHPELLGQAGWSGGS